MVTAANAGLIFEPGGKDFRSRARQQSLGERVRAVDALRVIRKWIKTEKSAASRSRRVSEGRAARHRAWILKNSRRARVIETALIDRRHGKTLLSCRVDELAFSREEIKQPIRNYPSADDCAALARSERVFAAALIPHHDSFAA